MNLESARAYILDRLDRELSVTLSYHSPQHTRDVTRAALRIAEGEGLSNEELLILETAALYHDSGFLFQYQHHEEQGCAIAKEFLPQFGYPEAAVSLICDCILATKIPQSPHTKLAEVLCDADLDYLGGELFFPIGNTLYKEFLHHGIITDEKAWNRMQIRFLESHSYFTQTAINERAAGKAANLEIVRSIVAGYDAEG